jgi:hypothetical protein
VGRTGGTTCAGEAAMGTGTGAGATAAWTRWWPVVNGARMKAPLELEAARAGPEAAGGRRRTARDGSRFTRGRRGYEGERMRRKEKIRRKEIGRIEKKIDKGMVIWIFLY